MDFNLLLINIFDSNCLYVEKHQRKNLKENFLLKKLNFNKLLTILLPLFSNLISQTHFSSQILKADFKSLTFFKYAIGG